MKRNFNKNVLIICLLLFSSIFYNCGRNITYVEKIDYTKRVQLKSNKCPYSELNIRIKEISVSNAIQDTFLVRSNRELSLYLKLSITNNGQNDVKFIIDNGINNPAYFNWILKIGNKKDTVGFYNYDLNYDHYIEPNDSLEFFLNTRLYSFENLCNDKNDCTENILGLLSNFKVVYNNKEKKLCISQDEDTKIIVYNDKSKWSWW